MTKIAVINNAEPGIREFAVPIEKIIQQCNVRSVFVEYVDCINFDFDSVDGAILTGSPQGDDIVEHHLPYFRWIKDFNKPLFGICAGHHVTAYLYGARLLRNKEPESGNFMVDVIKADPILKGIPESFKVKQMHNDSVTLPTNFELLATSATCKNQLMKHKHKPLYTSQFHPEYYNHDLLRNFIGLCV
jgi:GMP synthase (glutamine-hydrolysing)